MSTTKVIGLYLHIPFCQHKCSYCDFYSVVTLDEINRFVQALCREIQHWSERIEVRREVATIFWGGGTPTLLSPQHAEQIARTLYESFSIRPDVEWTIEANPGTVSLESLQCYRGLGINRISIGIQSFDEEELRFLERIHTAEEAEYAVTLARAAGFENINIDMMYGLPGQTLNRHRSNLERACALAPEHISAYSLVYEPGTPLYHRLLQGEVVPLHEEAEAELYDHTVELLATHGYEQYEVSNFAREGRQCRHNLLYWHRGEYLGFGPSAHSHWQNVRWSNIRSVKRYVAMLEQEELPVVCSETLSAEQQRDEEIFLGLRANGVRIADVERRYGISLLNGAIGQLVQEWISNELAIIDDGRLRLTKRGYAICDALTVSLLRAIDADTVQPTADFVDCGS